MGARYGKDIQGDLQILRQDVGDLAQQLTALLGDKGEEITEEMRQRVQKIRDDIDEVVSDVGAKGRELMRQAHVEGLTETIENSVRERPFTMLAIAMGIGAVMGAQLRRHH